MIRTTIASALTVLALATPAISAGGGDGHIEDVDFSFEGPFGTYDQMQLQRGLQVFTEVCSACHGLKFVPLRTLSDEGGPGLPEDQVRAYAAENFEVASWRYLPWRVVSSRDQITLTGTPGYSRATATAIRTSADNVLLPKPPPT